MAKKLIHDPMRPQLFSNEDLGLPPCEYEYRVIEKKDEQGHTLRQRIVRKTMDSFIRAAQAVWGDQYDYSESVLVNMKAPITIRCKKHNHYFTVPFAQNHIVKAHGNVRPTGCDLCEQERIGYYPANRGPHQLRSPEEIKRDEEEKARRREERERLVAEKTQEDEERRLHLLEIQKDYMRQWHAKTMKEARFNERVYQMYGDDLDTSVAGYINNHKPVLLICRHHGAFRISPRLLLRGENGNPPHGCWKCSGLTDPNEKSRMTAKRFYDIMRHLYQILDFTKYRRRKIKPGTKITAVCMKHGEITHDAQWWLDGKGCEYCNGKIYFPHWKEYARQKHGDKYEYVGDAPEKTSDIIHYVCPEHGLQEQRFDVHVSQGCGCPKCANYPNKKTPLERCNEWIAKCIEKYGEGRYDYSRAHEDYVNNDSLVWIRCCIHDYWFRQTPDNNLRTVNGSCPICAMEFKESEGEATIRRWLVKNGITDFIQDEYTIEHDNPRCKRRYLRPDFWLPGYNLFIEYNGEQHYEEVSIFNDNDWTYEDQVIRDETLRDYCVRYHHNLLEIPYWDFDRIGEILTDTFLK